MISTTIDVPAISCGHCKGAIEGAVGGLDGVKSVAVNIEHRHAAVLYDAVQIGPGSITAAIAAAGYEVPAASRQASA